MGRSSPATWCRSNNSARSSRTCTFVAAMLVMLISPVAMLPPFRLEIPVRHGSHSPVAGLDEPADSVGSTAIPARSSLASSPSCCPLAGGLLSSQLMKPIISICFGPRRASSTTITPSNRGSAALDWSSSWCRWASRWAGHAARSQGGRGSDRPDQGQRSRGDRAGAFAGDGARPRRPAGGLARAESQERLLADKLELIKASPQEELLRQLLERRSGQDPDLDPHEGANAGPGQVADLSRSRPRRPWRSSAPRRT